MNKIFTITKWEYIEKVRTKTFIISLVVFPLIIVGMSLFPILFLDEETEETKAFGFIDCQIDLFDEFVKEISEFKTSDDQPSYLFRLLNPARHHQRYKAGGSNNVNCSELKRDADKLVFEQKIEGYLFINGSIKDSVQIEYRGESASNVRDIGRFERKINNILTERKIKSAGLSPNLIKNLKVDLDIKPIKISKTGEEKETSIENLFWTSYIFVFLLMMLIVLTGQMLVRSVVEEKSNRIIEVLVSSCTADQLMAGKILGLSAIGLTQIFIWGIFGLIFAGPIGFTFIQSEHLLLSLLYFILGYIFYSAIFVAIGSLANSEHEAQQYTGYISILLIVPITISIQIMNEPQSNLVKILSYIPFTSPPVMAMKLNLVTVNFFEILSTIIILLLSIVFMIWIAGRIFRIGILSYGKTPSLKELLQWIKSDLPGGRQVR